MIGQQLCLILGNNGFLYSPPTKLLIPKLFNRTASQYTVSYDFNVFQEIIIYKRSYMLPLFIINFL